MIAAWAIIFGLAIGGAIGATVLLTNFCSLGAVADIVFAKDWRRMRAWILAAAVAVLGAQSLDAAGIVALNQSEYLINRILWLPALIGGVCFGFGMSLAGGCVNRAMVRVGAGSLKSLVTVLIVGLAAAITAAGVLSPVTYFLDRAGSLDLAGANGIAHILSDALALDFQTVSRVLAAALGGALLAFCLKDSWFRASRDHVAAGVLVGGAVTAAWAASGVLSGWSGERGAAAVNFVAPLGELTAALITDSAPTLFPVAIVLGVPLGAFIAGALTRNLAFESFSEPADLPRHLVGGALMGFGGTLTLGCTFGQGLSGLSTLSVNAMIVIAAIWFGCLWGIRYFETESVWGGLKLTLRRGMR